LLSNTPGKIEFYSTIAERLGLNPLPTQYALKQEKNTSILLNSATPKYTHTQFQEVYSAIPPVIIINPEDAYCLGVADGDIVYIYI